MTTDTSECRACSGQGERADHGDRAEPAKHAGCQCGLPQVTFSTFILSLASSTLVQLGEVPNPETGELEEDLALACHSIEVLTMLAEKTKGCLDSDEARLMEEILYEVRMKYVMKRR